jgi:hypothetical protein
VQLIIKRCGSDYLMVFSIATSVEYEVVLFSVAK